MPNVFGYGRVSTQRQADKGESLEAQEADIERVFACDYAHKGFQLAAVVRDPAESGGKPLLSRPGGAKLDSMLEKDDVVIFPKLDRGFRSTLDMLKTVEIWKKRGVYVRMLDINVDTSTSSGEMILTVMSAAAQFERKRIGERVRSTWAHRRKKRANGDDTAVCSSNPAYGFRVVSRGGRKVLERDDNQRDLGAAIVRWHEVNGMTFRAIWLHMLEQHIYRVTKKGSEIPWQSTTSVFQMYRREKRLRERESRSESSE